LYLLPFPVQEIAVVTDDQRTAGKPYEGIFQHTERRQIEIVCWFIERHEIAGLAQQLCQHCAALFAAGENGNFFEDSIAAKKKGSQDRSCGCLADRVPDLQLYMAGEGILRREYEKMANQLGLADRVRFLGLVQGAQKIAFLKGARFFVCPSRFEPFGIVVLEALAAGIPVIANRVGGIPDIIEDSAHGLLVDAESSEELGQAIVDLYKSPRACQEMSVNALERAREFDWMNVTKRYLEVYEKGRILFEEEKRELEEQSSNVTSP